MVSRRQPNEPIVEPLIKGLRFIRHLPNFVRLYWRLFRDRRVALPLKAVLVAALAYAIVPFDFLPDILPGLGQLDDFVILVVACRLFVCLCPAEVVQEHVRQIDAGG